MLKSIKQLLKSSPTVPVHDQAVPAQKASSAGPFVESCGFSRGVPMRWSNLHRP